MLNVLVSDLINKAGSILGIYSVDNPLSGTDTATFASTLNFLIDELGADKALLYSPQTLSFTTTAGQNTYTMNTTGGTPIAGVPNWQASFLPLNLEIMTFNLPANLNASSYNIELPIQPVTTFDWSTIPIKGIQTPIPEAVWVVLGNPYHTIYIYPTPSVSFTVNFYVWQSIPQLSLTSSVTGVVLNEHLILRPGYANMLIYELVIRASDEVGGNIPAWVPGALMKVKRNIKTNNYEKIVMTGDPSFAQGNNPMGLPGPSLIPFLSGQ